MKNKKMENKTKKQIDEMKKTISVTEKTTRALKVKLFKLEQDLNEEKLSEKSFSEKDLYDFAEGILYPKLKLSRRLDVIQDMTKTAVEDFKKIKGK